MEIDEKNTKKALGQHWLRDKDVLKAISDSANIQRGDYILEIGPGEGTLTDVLSESGANIMALEFDQELIPMLRKKYKNNNNVQIQEGDIRTFDYSKLPQDYKIVANIPYYLTSHLIRALGESNNQPSIAVLLIQEEVAQRICAKPGKMSILAITSQFFFKCDLGVGIKASMFYPPPKVNSQVVVLTRRSSALFNISSRQFFQVVKAGFSEKRKTLQNSLSGALNITKKNSELLLNNSSINPKARAQELSLAEWYTLCLNYQET